MDSATQTTYEQYAYQARLAGQARDWHGARAAWAQALTLLTPGTAEYQTVSVRIENIDAQIEASQRGDSWKRRFYRFGPLGAFLWKAKTILLVVAAKGKLLLFGLTKLQTLLSMLVFLGVYTSMYGWKFALGFVLSIYVHEMGHVFELRQYGIAATSPMFIPFLGAFVRLKAYPANVGQDARVGLAGPIWGLAAAIFCWGSGVLTGQPIWMAIARTGAWINLFNLIPIWQLDGGRGFRALTRKQRGYALAIALCMWAITEESMLLFISLGALYRLFSKDYPETADNRVLVEYGGLLVLLSFLLVLCGSGLR